MNELRSKASHDDGITVLETSVAMLVGALVITAMIGFITIVYKADDLHQADDTVVQELRIARELLARDLRSAEAVTVAEQSSLTLWLDGDRDDVQETGELVTWTIDADLGLTRQIDSGTPVVHVIDLLADESSFTYDSTTLSAITEIQFSLVGLVESDGGSVKRSVTTTIHLRNGIST